MWIKTENVIEKVMPRIQYIDDQGTKVGNIYYGALSIFTGTNDWSYTETGFTIPAGATGYKIEIFLGSAGNTKGTVWIDDVKAISTIPVKGFQLDNESSNLLPGESIILIPQFTPVNAGNKEVIWSSSDTAVASVSNGTVNALANGSAIITAKTADRGFTDSCIVLVGNLLGVSVQDITKTTDEDKTLTGNLTAVSNDGGVLSYTKLIDPANGILAVNENGSWSYTPNKYFTGEDSFKVLVKSTNGGVGLSTVKVTVVSISGPEFDAIRQSWFNRLTGGNGYDISDPDIASYINNIVTTAQKRWDTMDRSSNRTALWGDMANTAASWNIVWAYQELRTMALAYNIEGSSLYHNSALKDEIINAMDWMYANKYNENTPEYDNWFHWQISGPQAINDILVLMYSELSPAQIDNYMRAIDYYVQDPAHKGTDENPGDIQTGANLTDRVMVVALRGIIGKNSAKVAAARDALSPVFPYVTSGDGFYEDGSFVQHTYVAYIGGYGASLIKSLSNVLNLLDGTRYEVTDPNLNNAWDWIPNSYEPFIYKGGMMDMVKGRSFGTDGHATGRSTIISLIRLLDGMPADKAFTAKKMIKEWVLSDTTFSNYYATTEFSISEIIKLKEILNDSSIGRRGELVDSKIFPYMANAVHSRPEFGFAVSMFSNTISAFENGNGQNLNGWYTGTGMTYLYNNDLTQYTNIEKTIDMYRLPGTTTDGTKGVLVGWKKYSNPKTWVGGSTMNNLFSSIGMDFSMTQNTGSPLSGKKSWFMLGDKVVALGSSITNTNSKNTETIIENRKLNDSGTNPLTVNGAVYQDTVNWSNTFTGVNWAHLQGNVPGSDIGYYFPNSTDIYGLREKKEGIIKVFPAADAFVGDGKNNNTNYGKNENVTVRSNGTSYNYEGYFKFDLSNIQGNIVSANLKLYPTGVYANANVNYAETVSSNWAEEEIKWSNKLAATGNLLGSWKPVKGKWVTIDATASAQSATSSENKNISFRIYPDNIYTGGSNNDTVTYAARENTSTGWRPYLEIVTDESTDIYQSLAFEHGVDPTDANYAYAILPNKTAEEMASYASNPDITILENSTDLHAVKDSSLNIVGANFWNDITKTLNIDGVQYLTSDKAASVTTIEEGNILSVAVSDPTKVNTGVINIEINKPVAQIKDLDPGITITQLSPTLKMTVNVNEANGKSFNAKFNILSTDASLVDLKYEASANRFETVSGFVYSKNEYSVVMPYGTNYIPQVTVTGAAYAKVDITQAAALPGIAVIKVTAEDGITTQEYRVRFTVGDRPEENQEDVTPVPKSNPVPGTNENKDVEDAIKEYKDVKSENKAKMLEKVLETIEKVLDKALTIEDKFIEQAGNTLSQNITVKKGAIENLISKLAETKQNLESTLKNAGLENVVNTDRKEIRLEIKEIIKQEMKISIPAESMKALEAHKIDLLIEVNGMKLRVPAAALALDKTAAQMELTIKKVDTAGLGTFEGLTTAGDVLNLDMAVNDGTNSKKIENFNSKVTVIIPYNGAGVNEDKLGIYRYNPETKTWDYVGGKVNKEDKTVEFTTPHFSIYTVMEYNKTFNDIVNHWAKNDIELMAAKHIVLGKDEANFAPEDKLTRAEFAATLVRALGLDLVKYSNSFSDVSSDKWYAGAVQTASIKGLIKGDGVTFRPEDAITREEMTALMIRAYKLAAGKSPVAGDISKFQDKEQISSWAQEDVKAAYGMGLIKGTGNDKFSPEANATRAEAAAIVKRFLEKI